MAQRNRVYTEDPPPDIRLHLWVCTDHDKHQQEAKVSSIILAHDEDEAIKILDKALITAGLRPKNMWRYRLEKMPMNKAFAEVLNDGDY